MGTNEEDACSVSSEQDTIRQSDRDGTPQGVPRSLPVIDEIASVSKRTVSTGRVRVRTRTIETQSLAQAELMSESVEAVSVKIDRIVEVAPEIRVEGDVTIIPVVEEVLFVEKRLVLREEIHLRRRVQSQHVELPVTLRKQEAVVERFDAADTPPSEPDR